MVPPANLSKQPVYSTNALKRWSSINKDLPLVQDIKALHVYDFDNTLFSSPLPNPQLWSPQTIGYLQSYECFFNGGWWHDPSILAATGDGIEKEEARGWKDWWNDEVVKLVELSVEQKDALTVILTGRGETNFADLLKTILTSKNLDCDILALKPEVGPAGQRFATTMGFKQEFLRDLVFTYKTADEVRIYEDRQRHVKGFREYFEKLNKSLLSHPIDQPPPPRKPITAEVIQVAELNVYLDPIVECTAVQRLINRHNIAFTTKAPNITHSPFPRMQIKQSFLYCGYLINANDSARLISLANIPTVSLIDSGEVKLMASGILISPRPASKPILEKVGGIGNKVTWQVTGTAVLENRIWAARVAPVSDKERIHTPDQVPFVVLAMRKGSRQIDAGRIQNWQPVAPEKAFIFETVVGEKVMLKIEPEESDDEDDGFRPPNNNVQNLTGQTSMKRKYGESGWKGRENPGVKTSERDEGNWTSKDRNGFDSNYAGPIKQPNSGDRHGQGRYFNQMPQQNDGRSFSGNRGGGNVNRGAGRGGGAPRRGDHQNYNGGNGRSGPRSNDRARGGGGKSRGSGNRGGPGGYKSLDDYGPGGFDGQGDYGPGGSRSGGGEVVMNY